jgi:hypothetical protein
MERRKPPNAGFWCCVATSLAVAYVAAYGFCRWQNVLIYDVKYWTAVNGMSYCGYGVRDSPYHDETEPWQECLGPPAELVFLPLCEVETSIRQRLRQSRWRDASLD